MSEVKTVSATLNIKVNVECPHCDSYIDLLNPDDTSDYYHNEDGHILEQTCPNGYWVDEHKKFSVDDVACTECKGIFNVKELEW